MQGHDIIVIGASAGGVEALKELVAQLPPDLPAVIFAVVHFPPHSTSIMPRILSRAGALPATQPSDGEEIQKGHVYLSAPDHHLLIKDGTVRQVHGPRENLRRPAIDPLFRTAGLQVIKAFGGVTMAQDPEEAIYPEMPRSAIEHVGVDYILPLSKIAHKVGGARARACARTKGESDVQRT